MSIKKFLLASAAFALVTAAQMGTASSGPNCPPARHYSGSCIQVIVWAQSPDGTQCCQYSTPCSAPSGWTIFYGPGCSNTTVEL
jgi:hypothetical protein